MLYRGRCFLMSVFSRSRASSSVRVTIVSRSRKAAQERLGLGPFGPRSEVCRDPLLQGAGFPDVEKLSLVPAEEVDARGIGQILRRARVDHVRQFNADGKAGGRRFGMMMTCVPMYECPYCYTPVEPGTPVCPNCGRELERWQTGFYTRQRPLAREVAHGGLGRGGGGAAPRPRGIRARLSLDMNRSGVASVAAAVFLAAAASARAQTRARSRAATRRSPATSRSASVPRTRRRWTPGNNLGQGNTGISMSTEFADGIRPKIDQAAGFRGPRRGRRANVRQAVPGGGHAPADRRPDAETDARGRSGASSNPDPRAVGVTPGRSRAPSGRGSRREARQLFQNRAPSPPTSSASRGRRCAFARTRRPEARSSAGRPGSRSSRGFPCARGVS